ncbi:9-cis-epoxycarotenoid dioxygenase [Sesbania bispinosa]|nr:9-cis-epoxycarotenoid dioxygenase [Sesbania bispinosa]
MSALPLFRLLMFYLQRLFGLVNFRQGTGPANIGLIFFNMKLIAMSEEDLPYKLRITPSSNLKIVGPYSFDIHLNSSMIAHSKPHVLPVLVKWEEVARRQS